MAPTQPVLGTNGDRQELRIERRIAHPAEKVWRALVEPAQLSKWYPFQATEIDLRTGGRIRFDDTQGTTLDGDATEEPRVGRPVPIPFTAREIPAGVVTAVESARLLEYDWHAAGRQATDRPATDRPAGRVRWELATGPGGARIILTQTGPPELAEQRSRALTGWKSHLDSLARQLNSATR